jgi:hypothetical protein
MTSLASCCARMVNQNKWPTVLHDRVDVTTRYNIYIYRFYLFTQGNNISNNRKVQTSKQRSCTNADKLDHNVFLNNRINSTIIKKRYCTRKTEFLETTELHTLSIHVIINSTLNYLCVHVSSFDITLRFTVIKH